MLRGVVIAACILLLGSLDYRIWRFQSEMADLNQAIAIVPYRQRLQPIMTEPHSSQFRTYPFLHAAAWYNADKGGFSPYLFTKQAHFPVRERRTAIPGTPGEWNMDAFRYAAHGTGTDYFLAKTENLTILNDLAGNVPLAGRFGEWVVFGPNPRP